MKKLVLIIQRFSKSEIKIMHENTIVIEPIRRLAKVYSLNTSNPHAETAAYSVPPGRIAT